MLNEDDKHIAVDVYKIKYYVHSELGILLGIQHVLLLMHQ